MRGLTTASAIWITAGLGMACGAGLFFTATLGALVTVLILEISSVQQLVQTKVWQSLYVWWRLVLGVEVLFTYLVLGMFLA